MTVTCDVHGPMKYREPLHWWECLGFDGEGPAACGVMILYDEDIKDGRGIPGVTVTA
jgi:hypothetical protein